MEGEQTPAQIPALAPIQNSYVNTGGRIPRLDIPDYTPKVELQKDPYYSVTGAAIEGAIENNSIASELLQLGERGVHKVKSLFDDSKPLSEDEWKQTEYYHPQIVYSDNMTENEAKWLHGRRMDQEVRDNVLANSSKAAQYVFVGSNMLSSIAVDMATLGPLASAVLPAKIGKYANVSKQIEDLLQAKNYGKKTQALIHIGAMSAEGGTYGALNTPIEYYLKHDINKDATFGDMLEHNTKWGVAVGGALGALGVAYKSIKGKVDDKKFYRENEHLDGTPIDAENKTGGDHVLDNLRVQKSLADIHLDEGVSIANMPLKNREYAKGGQIYEQPNVYNMKGEKLNVDYNFAEASALKHANKFDKGAGTIERNADYPFKREFDTKAREAFDRILENFDPKLMFGHHNNDLHFGSIITNDKGVVFNGNKRALAFDLLDANQIAKNKEYFKSIGHNVDDMQNPVPVRKIENLMNDKDEKQIYDWLHQKSEGKEQFPKSEQEAGAPDVDHKPIDFGGAEHKDINDFLEYQKNRGTITEERMNQHKESIEREVYKQENAAENFINCLVKNLV